jgi:hypothetical protein
MRLFILFTLILISGILSAQKNPVSWTFRVEQIKGDEYRFIATASMQKNWKIYSLTEVEDGPVPTSFEFGDINGCELMGEIAELTKGAKKFDEFFGVDVVTFSGTADFGIKFKKSAASGVISGELEYMTCDDKSCLPPKTVPFEVKF